MIIDIIIFTVCLAAMIIASIHDIKTREVPDWLNYSLIFSGFSIRLIYSLITSDWWFLLYGIAGFAALLGIGLIMFYAGQWGGGDSKMIMGLGALLGIDFMHYQTLFAESMLIGFFINMLFIGAAYGLLWSITMAAARWKGFAKEFSSIRKTKKFMLTQRVSWIIILAVLVSLFFLPDQTFRMILITFAFMLLLLLYLWPFVKSVENICMYKMVTPDKLTEGDWIAEDINVAGELICSPKDLGIEKKQITKLIKLAQKGKIQEIRIKEGIPFVPSFLISFVITLIWGNLLVLLI
ncbi:MAG: prepilin peptidase [Nanoarchaeota archaeon]|nr:prepilin peptidase [Nanoarchaeota archaeon]